MSEGTRPKYDNLPGIDTAPDIYETPELAEDVSTIQASTAVSESDGEGDDDDPRDSAVRHQRLQPDQARRLPSPLDASVVAVIALSLLCRYGCPAHRTPSSLVNMLDPTSSRYTPA